MAAPSGKDVRPWELIVIDDREVLDSMAAVLPYAKMLKEAPTAIVVCGDTTVNLLIGIWIVRLLLKISGWLRKRSDQESLSGPLHILMQIAWKS